MMDAGVSARPWGRSVTLVDVHGRGSVKIPAVVHAAKAALLRDARHTHAWHSKAYLPSFCLECSREATVTRPAAGMHNTVLLKANQPLWAFGLQLHHPPDRTAPSSTACGNLVESGRPASKMLPAARKVSFVHPRPPLLWNGRVGEETVFGERVGRH